MQRHTFILALSAAVCGLGAHSNAQTFTSPSGFLNTPGGTYQTASLGYHGAQYHTYLVQIDNTLVGTPRPDIHTISFRRSPSIGTFSFPGRYMDIEIRMTHGDYSRVQHDTNRWIGFLEKEPWVTVYFRKRVYLPSWSVQPGEPVPPWSVQLPLDVHFDYNGTDALLWQVHCTPNNLGGTRSYPADFYEEQQYSQNTQVQFGIGCTAAGQSSSMRENSYLKTYGSTRDSLWTMTTMRAPASASVWALIGLFNPNANVGLCAPLYASPSLVLPKGRAFSSGTAVLNLRFPHQASFVGTRLYVQSLSLDPSKSPPFVLSSGARSTYAPPPTFQREVAFDVQSSAFDRWPSFAELKKGSGIVTGFTHTVVIPPIVLPPLLPLGGLLIGSGGLGGGGLLGG